MKSIKHYYVAPIFYFPLQHAVSLVNQGYPPDEAASLTISRFARFGKNNTKRLKSFDQNQFRRHLNKFITIPGAVLVRKSPKHHSR